jgi:hypothetical protein
MRWYLAMCSMAALLALTGCPANLDTPRYPTSRPSNADLIGVYRATAETATLVHSTGGYAAREMSITFDADGSLHVENIPDWWRTEFGKPAGGFDSGIGTWTTEKHQEWWILRFEFTEAKGFSTGGGSGSISIGVNMIGQRSPYDIALTVGDPDSGREMRFSRSSSTKAAGP